MSLTTDVWLATPLATTDTPDARQHIRRKRQFSVSKLNREATSAVGILNRSQELEPQVAGVGGRS